MILIVDNYDSFTYNLVQRLGEIDSSLNINVVRNDKASVEQLVSLDPTHVIISPGPCTPKEAGISVDCVKAFHGNKPLLGVCLGHQSIGAASGGEIVRADKLMHGKTDLIEHDGSGIFQGVPSPMVATRYHSLVIKPETLADDFVVNAWVHDGGQRQIMGVRHQTHETFGVQFHPESFLTERGVDMLKNFIQL